MQPSGSTGTGNGYYDNSRDPASPLGLAGQASTEPGCVDLAWRAGINYFFSYSMGDGPFFRELRQLLQSYRESVIVAPGSENRSLTQWTNYLEEIRRTLGIPTVDILFVEYVSPSDNWDQVLALLEGLYQWKEQGLIRYVGVTTHNRDLGLQLAQNSLCDILMHRYNMAHRKAEDALFPAAQASEIPVVAFTNTRWGTLLQRHSEWSSIPPSASDYYRFSLYHPAIRLALTAPKTLDQLEENLIETPSFENTMNSTANSGTITSTAFFGGTGRLCLSLTTPPNPHYGQPSQVQDF